MANDGKRTAREVEVLLTGSYRDDPMEWPTSFRDEPLPWVGGESARTDIPPGVERRAVVLYAGDTESIFYALRPTATVIAGIPEEYQEKFQVCVAAFPGHGRTIGDIHWIEDAIPFDLSFTVTAADTDALSFDAQIVLTARGTGVYPEWLLRPTLQNDAMEREPAPSWYTTAGP